MNIGCTSDVIAWFRNYFTDRFQRVITHEESTQWLPVSRGLPQGSRLNPLLFNICVRKLPEKCISDIFQFADDTTLAAADPSLEVVTTILTTSFNATKEFCHSLRLIISAAKTQSIIFKAARKCIPQDYHLILDNCTITTQTSVKLLGVTLDSILLLFLTHRLIMLSATAVRWRRPNEAP